jgi:hypothetical protein
LGRHLQGSDARNQFSDAFECHIPKISPSCQGTAANVNGRIGQVELPFS